MKVLERRTLGLTLLASLAMILLATAHIPPVRARVLSWLFTDLLPGYGLEGRADSMSYNLFTMSARFENVTLAARGKSDAPFLTVRTVTVDFPLSVLRQDAAAQTVALEAPSVTITRAADGTTNWPTMAAGEEAGDDEEGGPVERRFRIDELFIDDLDVVYSDVGREVDLELLGLTLRLAAAGREPPAGPLTMAGSARLRVGDRATEARLLDGHLRWDGLDLGLEPVTFELPEGRLVLEGRLSSLLSGPEWDVRYESTLRLESAGTWIDRARPMAGTVDVIGQVEGPITRPRASMEATGEALNVGRLDGVAIDLTSQVDGNGIRLESLALRGANGELTGDGQMRFGVDAAADFQATPSEVSLAWHDIDVGALLSAFTDEPPLLLATAASGRLDARWRGLSPADLEATLENRSVALVAGPNAVTVEGRSSLQMARGAWTLTADHLVGGALQIDGIGRGSIPSAELLDSTVSGTLALSVSELSRGIALARHVGPRPPTGLEDSVRGSIHADLALEGTLGRPEASGVLSGTGLAYDDTTGATVTAKVTVTPEAVYLEPASLRLGDNTLDVSAQYHLDSEGIEGSLEARLGDLSGIPLIASRWGAAGALDAHGRLAGRLSRPEIDITLSGRELSAAGQRVDRLSGLLTLDRRGVLRLERLRAAQADGSLTLEGQYAFDTSEYAVTLEGTNLSVAPVRRPSTDVVPVTARLDVRFQGTGTRASPGGTGRVDIHAASWAETDLPPAAMDLSMSDDTLSVEATAPELAATASARVSLASPGDYRVTGTLTGTDIGRLLGRVVGNDDPVTGAVTADFETTGTMATPGDVIFTVDLQKVDASFEDTPVRLVEPARLRYSRSEISTEDLELHVGSSIVRASGRLTSTPSGRLGFTVDGDLDDLRGFLRHVGSGAVQAVTALSGSLHADLAAVGTIDAPELIGTLTLDAATVEIAEHPPVTAIAATADLQNGVITIDRLNADWQGARVSAVARLPMRVLGDRLPASYLGTLPLSSEPATLSASADALAPALLAPYVDARTLAELDGLMSASLELEGESLEPDALRGELRLDRAELSIAGVPFSQQRPTRLTLRGGRLDVADLRWGGSGNDFAVEGSVSLTEPVRMDLTALGNLDLRALSAVLPQTATSGRARLYARVEGPPSEPVINGQISIIDTELRVSDPRLAVTDLNGSLALARNRVIVERLTGLANGGLITIEGDLGYRRFEPTDGSIRLTGSQIALEVPAGLRSEADAELVLGIEDGRMTLGGDVTILRGNYRDSLILTNRLLSALERQALSARTQADGRDLSLNVRVQTQNDISVDSNYGQLAIGADLRLIGTLSRPALAGRASILEGGAIFLGGTTYRIESGSIDFTNPNQIEPELDITARTRISAYDITLQLTGTPATLQADLSSTDSRLDQSDLVSLLVTGRTIEQAGSAGTEVAGEQVLGYLSGEFLGEAGRAVGLDVLRVGRGEIDDLLFDPGLVATETNPASRLTFGKNVRRDVQVIFSRDLTQNAGLTWIVGYNPRSNVELRAVSRDNTDRSYEFRHDLAFGHPESARERRSAVASPAERVASIRLSGQPGFDEKTVLDLLRLKVGDRFDFYEWQGDRERLEAFYDRQGYREVQIASRRSEVAGPGDEPALALEYDIERGPLSALSVEGYAVSDSLRSAMEEAWRRSVFDQFLVDDLERLTRMALADDGYLQATIDVRVETGSEPGRKEIAVRVEPGPHTTDRRFEFVGNEQIASDRLAAIIGQNDLRTTAWTDPLPLQQALTSFYEQRGWLNAKIGVASPVFTDAVATLPIQVDEGARFRVASVTLEGVTARAESDVRGILGVEPGRPFSVTELEGARRRLDTSYRRAGFNAVKAQYLTSLDDEAASVAVTFIVDEGSQQVLSEIVVTGTETTRHGVIERAINLRVGDPVDLERWYRARKRLYDTGIFRRADIEAEPIEASDEYLSGVQPVRARVILEEWPRFRVRYGFQVNDEEPLDESSSRLTPGFVSDFEYRNLLGRAIRTGVAFRVDQDTRAARTFIATPTLFGLPVTSSLFFSRSRTEFGDATFGFIENRTALTGEQRFRPLSRMQVSYAYSFERNRTFDRDLDPTDPFAFDLTVDIARLTSALVYDSRNDLFDTTSGWFHSSSFEYAPKTLGSDLRFAKYLTQQRYYRELPHGLVAASAVRLGLAAGFDHQELIPTERFFAGGGNSVRGYREDSLGPVDFGFPSGGDALLVLNEELRFPIYRFVRGVGFLDAGNVFSTLGDLSIGDLRSSVGFGFRIDTPFVLLRIDYGRALKRRTTDPTGRWFFSIGQMF